jgi:hypothetical protein
MFPIYNNNKKKEAKPLILSKFNVLTLLYIILDLGYQAYLETPFIQSIG